jgi:lysophospholipase L1-like esterase
MLAVTTGHSSDSSSPAPFVSGDRWGVLGDSITRSGQYYRYIELFYLTRFPSMSLEVINCGVSGDTSHGALQRLQWDCLEAKPTVVSIMLGMNDVRPALYNPDNLPPDVDIQRAKAEETYKSSMQKLAESLLAAEVKVILITPSIFDDTAELPRQNSPGCGAALGAFADRVREIAKELKTALVDFNGVMTSVNLTRQKINPSFTIVGGDRIHPTAPGHFVMAYEFLRAQGLGGPVFSIEVDAASGQTGVLQNCEVRDLKIQPGRVAFTSWENSLPFPVEAAASPALELVPFMQEFNRQIVTVRGLEPSDYTLKIDDQEIGKFTAEQLAEGVDLAGRADTPQAKQAAEVLAALGKKWDVVAKLRNLAVCEHAAWPDATRPIEPEEMQSKLDARAKRAGNNPSVNEAHSQYLEDKPREADLRAEAAQAGEAARLLAQPKPHRFTIERAVTQPVE